MIYLPIPTLDDLRRRNRHHKVSLERSVALCLSIAIQVQPPPRDLPHLDGLNGGHNRSLKVKYGHWVFPIVDESLNGKENNGVLRGFAKLLVAAAEDLRFALQLQFPGQDRAMITNYVNDTLLPSYWPKIVKDSLPIPTVYNQKNGFKSKFNLFESESVLVSLEDGGGVFAQDIIAVDGESCSVQFTKHSFDLLKTRFPDIRLAKPDNEDDFNGLSTVEVDLTRMGAGRVVMGAAVRAVGAEEQGAEEQGAEEQPPKVSTIPLVFCIFQMEEEEDEERRADVLRAISARFGIVLNSVLKRLEGLDLVEAIKARIRTDKREIADGLATAMTLESDKDNDPGMLCAFHVNSAVFAARVEDGAPKRAVGLIVKTMMKYGDQETVEGFRDMGLENLAQAGERILNVVGDKRGREGTTTNGIESIWSSLKRRREGGCVSIARTRAGLLFDLVCFLVYRFLVLEGTVKGRLRLISPSPGGTLHLLPRIRGARELARMKMGNVDRKSFPSLGPQLADQLNGFVQTLQTTSDIMRSTSNARALLQQTARLSQQVEAAAQDINSARTGLKELIDLDNLMGGQMDGKRVLDYALERCGKRQRIVGPAEDVVNNAVNKAFDLNAAVVWEEARGQLTPGRLREERILVLQDGAMDGFTAIVRLVGRNIVDECRARWEVLREAQIDLNRFSGVTGTERPFVALLNLLAERRMTGETLPPVAAVLNMTILIAKEGGIVEKYGEGERMICMYLSDEGNWRYQLIANIS